MIWYCVVAATSYGQSNKLQKKPDVEQRLRNNFPLCPVRYCRVIIELNMRVYLDHNATTPLRVEVRDAMMPFLGECWGNPASLHWYGQRASHAVETARAEVAALFGYLEGSKGSRHRLVATAIEHPAILEAAHELELAGFPVQRMGVDADGRCRPEEAARMIGEDVALVSIMLANNEVGTLQPLSEIAGIARTRGTCVHTDAVQAAGRIFLDVEALGVDMLSLSAHKIGGPPGIGALYVRKGISIKPRSYGGAQEYGRRAGTLNVPGIVGFGRACALAKNELEQADSRMAVLRDRLERAILEQVAGAYRNGHGLERLPNTLSLGFEGVDGASLAMMLDVIGVAASNGSACSSGTGKPSHVLAAMGLDQEGAASSLRFSLGMETTRGEIDSTIEAVVEAVRSLREARS